jgi:AcrR family transcriptional regulator
MQFFGSKEGLFAAVLRDYADVSDNLHAAATGAVVRRGERFARASLEPWEHPIRGQSLRSLVRATIGSPRAAGPFLAELKASLSKSGIPRRSRSRYLLAASELLGVAIARYILEVPELVAMPTDELVDLLAPAVAAQLGKGR